MKSQIIIVIALALTAQLAHAQEFKFESAHMGLVQPDDAVRIAVTGTGNVAHQLLIQGPIHWFGAPDYSWYDWTDSTYTLIKKIMDFSAKYGDEEAQTAAADWYERQLSNPTADYEFFCEPAPEKGLHWVTAINLTTGKSQTATVSDQLLLVNPLKALHPVLQAFVNIK